MIPPYYCPTCDQHDNREHDHTVAPVLVLIGLLAFAAMMFVVICYVLGLIP